MSTPPLRIGLFGGSFDPPHAAHTALVRAAQQQLQLSVVRVLPTGQAWHRQHLARQPSAARHRLAMARLAFADMPGVVVDEREMARPGPTFTIDTVGELQAEQPNAVWWLLLGQDQWQSFSTWHQWQALAALVQVAVAVRGAVEGAVELHPAEYVLPEQPGGQGQTVLRPTRLQMPSMNVSATNIRALAQQQASLAGLVKPDVARYIDQHHLYR